MAAQRVQWIDITKGFAIFCLLMVHSCPPPPKTSDFRWLYIPSFLMPLFFWISGYVFGLKRQPGFVEFTKKRVKSLLVPYVLFFVILYAYSALHALARSKWSHQGAEWSFITPLWGFVYSSSDTLLRVHMPLWFLTCLFLIELSFYWIVRLVKRQYQLLLILLACAVVCWVISGPSSPLKIPVLPWGTNRLPWGTDVAFAAIVFYGLGYLLRVNEHWLVPKNVTAKAAVMIGAIGVGFLFSWLNGWINFPTMRFNRSHLLVYAGAISGITGYVMFCQLIPASRALLYLGKNTLTIMAFNFVGLDVLRVFVSRVVNVEFGQADQSIFWGIIYAAGCVLVSIPAIYLINNHFPFVLGKRKQKLTGVGA
jgi:fucose 4-O-acetylase-like acetyltransferase